MSLSWLPERVSNKFRTGGQKSLRSCSGRRSPSRTRHCVRPRLEPLEERYLLDGKPGLSYTSIAGQIIGAGAGMVAATAKPPAELTTPGADPRALKAWDYQQLANFSGNAMNFTSGILAAVGAPGSTGQGLKIAGDGTQLMSAMIHGGYASHILSTNPSLIGTPLGKELQNEIATDTDSAISFGIALGGDITGLFNGQAPKLIGDSLASLHDGLSFLVDLGQTPANPAAVIGDAVSLIGDITGLINDALGDDTPAPILQINDIGYDPSTTARYAFVAAPAAGFNYAGPVAYFSVIPPDPNSYTPPAPNTFSALINWGDGTTSTGIVESDIGSLDTADPAGGYVIVGSHTYAAAGDYPISVMAAGNGMQAQDQGDVTVAPDFDSNSVEPNYPEPTAGQMFSGPVVSFTSNVEGNQDQQTFAATIHWGDGSTSAGQISNGQVLGSHIYANPGSYTAQVRITAPDGTRASGSTLVDVAPAQQEPQGLNANSYSTTITGLTYSGPVATFTDSNGDTNPGDYSAAIDWDGNTTSAGQIVYNNDGTFSVLGTQTFAQPGIYPISDVAITDPQGNNANVYGSSVMAGLSLTANNITVPAGQLFNTTIANFTWADPNAQASDFDVTVDWGGGTSDIYGVYVPDFQVISNGNGNFSIVGNHTYLGAGQYTLAISVTGPYGVTATVNSTLTAGAVNLTVTAQNLSINPGPSANIATAGARTTVAASDGSVNGIVATFTAPAGVSAGDYTAAINWGDGNISTGQVVANADGSFSVLGSHTYSQIAGYLTSVQVSDNNGNIASAFGIVSPPPPTSSVNPLPAVETSPSFTVSWSGRDPNGPGIASYNVYVSDNGGAFTPWLTDTTQTSATFTGQAGHNYGFYTVASDQLGNTQPTPTAAQATTTVQMPGSNNNNPGGNNNNSGGNNNNGNNNNSNNDNNNTQQTSHPTPPDVPPLLAWLNQVLGDIETSNASGTTITVSLFGFPLVETYSFSGSIMSVTLLGFNITFLF